MESADFVGHLTRPRVRSLPTITRYTIPPALHQVFRCVVGNYLV